MRIIIFFAVFIVYAGAVTAQTVKVSDGIIYKNDSAYALLKKTGMGVRVFTVESLTGEKLMLIKEADFRKYLTVIFLKSGRKIRMESETNNQKHIATQLIFANVIVNNAVDSAGEKLFCTINADDKAGDDDLAAAEKPGRADADDNSDSPALIDRNRDGEVFSNAGIVTQGGKPIGTVTEKTDLSNTEYNVIYKVMLPDNTLIAMGYMKEMFGKTVKIVTAKDHKTYNIAVGTLNEQEQIAKFLVEKLYL